MSFLEPWVMLRVLVAAVVAWAFVRAAITGARVVRRFDAASRAEGQLLLERHLELAATYVRVGAVLQVLSLAIAVLGADRLARGVRGAMCAFGVFSANEWGMRSLVATLTVALAAGIASQVFAFDGRLRTLALARPLAWLSIALAPMALVDLALAVRFASALDLSVVASCCSVQLDSAAARAIDAALAPRVPVTVAALVAAVVAVALTARARALPAKPRLAAAALASLVAVPLAALAVALEVAPHVFEAPGHVCPFCLLRADAGMIGYPLFLALFLAASWAGGAGLSAVLAADDKALELLAPFARPRLARALVAWAVALVLAVAPVARYAALTGGASLFP